MLGCFSQDSLLVIRSLELPSRWNLGQRLFAQLLRHGDLLSFSTNDAHASRKVRHIVEFAPKTFPALSQVHGKRQGVKPRCEIEEEFLLNCNRGTVQPELHPRR